MSPRSGLNARGSLTSPRVKENLLGNLKFFLDSKLGAREANAETDLQITSLPFGRVLASFFVIFRTFSYFFEFFRLLESSLLLFSLFVIFLLFFIDFGRILGGSGEDFSKIFRAFLKNVDFVKYSVFPEGEIDKIKGWTSKKSIEN